MPILSLYLAICSSLVGLVEANNFLKKQYAYATEIRDEIFGSPVNQSYDNQVIPIESPGQALNISLDILPIQVSDFDSVSQAIHSAGIRPILFKIGRYRNDKNGHF